MYQQATLEPAPHGRSHQQQAIKSAGYLELTRSLKHSNIMYQQANPELPTRVAQAQQQAMYQQATLSCLTPVAHTATAM
jgi:hypothetical protein